MDQLHCNFSDYIIDNYVHEIFKNIFDYDALFFTLANLLLFEYPNNNIIAKIMRKYFELRYIPNYISFFSIAKLDWFIHNKVIADIFFNLIDSNVGSIFPRIIISSEYTKPMNLKLKLLTNMNININYPSKINTQTLTTLCLISRIDKYKKIGFKHIIKKIIEYLYSTL
jgi:hypothetical protein